MSMFLHNDIDIFDVFLNNQLSKIHVVA